MSKKKKKSRTHRKMSGGKKLLLLFAEILLLLVLLVILYVWRLWNKVDYTGSMDATEAGINEDISEESTLLMSQYTNIALFGLDNRSKDKYGSGNSDSIMIASINNETREIRLVSVYRDTYLNIGEKNGETIYRKANAAYALGGSQSADKASRPKDAAANAVKMLNRNLDLNIQEYVCVDWNALVEVIDAVGGVEIEITDEEVKYINYYLEETAKGAKTSSEQVTQSGKQLLDGVQATSYARIRYTKGDDYKRASRQRIVLQALLTKVKSADFSKLSKIANSVVDDIATSLSLADILLLAKNVKDYDLVSTTGFPFALTTKELPVTKSTVIPIDLSQNVKELHEYLFGEETYTASATVSDISNTIMIMTGVNSQTPSVDISELNDIVGADGTDSLQKTESGTTD